MSILRAFGHLIATIYRNRFGRCDFCRARLRDHRLVKNVGLVCPTRNGDPWL